METSPSFVISMLIRKNKDDGYIAEDGGGDDDDDFDYCRKYNFNMLISNFETLLHQVNINFQFPDLSRKIVNVKNLQ